MESQNKEEPPSNQQDNIFQYGLGGALEIYEQNDPNLRGVELGNITPYESRLLQALREHPDRVQYWLKRGRPDRCHKKLIRLYSSLFELLAQEGIRYWLDFGSLLGYVRHKGIFPWEYDMDIGVTEDEFERLQALQARLEERGSEWQFKWHSYEDWSGHPDYVFYNVNDPEPLFCDVTTYVRCKNSSNCNDTAKTMTENKEKEATDLLRCYVQEWNYPDHTVQEVFPLRRVTIFGQPALVPQDSEKYLRLQEETLGQITLGSVENVNKVKWVQYDPVPFLLTQLHNPQHAQKLCRYSLQDVRRVASVADAQPQQPFLLKRAAEKQTNNDTSILKQFDTPQKESFYQLGENDYTVFTAIKGEFSFILAPPEQRELILTHASDSIEELLYLQEHILWGVLLQACLQAGDMLYVPRNWLVRRQSYGNSSCLVSVSELNAA